MMMMNDVNDDDAYGMRNNESGVLWYLMVPTYGTILTTFRLPSLLGMVSLSLLESVRASKKLLNSFISFAA